MGPTFRLMAPVRAVLETVNNRGHREAILRGLLPLLADGARILDVGCDDGTLPAELMRRNASLRVVGVDVQDLRPARIPKVVSDGGHLPFPDASFDVVMAVDVLHHTSEIMSVLREMTRVSSRQVLIKDHVWDGHNVTWLLLSLFDWCTNTPYGIRCAYNFPKLERWLAYFRSLDLRCRVAVPIAHLPFRLNEKFNRIFLLEKSNRAREDR
jgi:ubiquinone/menaquinone biosynthesis C-methylase UbiE